MLARGWVSCGFAVIGASIGARVAHAINAGTVASAYVCGICTDAEMERGVLRLGQGRHLLFDFSDNSPRIYFVDKASSIAPVVPTREEQHRFELSKRLYSESGPWRFSEDELDDWLAYRGIPHTAGLFVTTSALRNDLIGAVEVLWPSELPTADAPSSQTPPRVQWELKAPEPTHNVSVQLDDGGTAVLGWSDTGLVVRELKDASGVTLPFSP